MLYFLEKIKVPNFDVLNDNFFIKKKKQNKKLRLARKSSRKSSIHNSENKEAQGDSPGTSFSNLSKITPVRKLSRALSRLLSFRRSSESGKSHYAFIHVTIM